jgi:hypothetical protein
MIEDILAKVHLHQKRLKVLLLRIISFSKLEPFFR